MAESVREKDERKLERTGTPGIYKRGNRYVVTGRDEYGKQVKKFAETMREARDKKAELRTDVRRGEYRPRSQQLFTEYADDWAKRYEGRGKKLKPQTIKDYQAAIARKEFRAHFRSLRLSEIDASVLNDYGNRLKQKDLAPQTIRNLITPIRVCLAYAHRNGHLRVNPAAGVSIDAAVRDKTREKKARAYEQHEIAALLGAFDPLAANADAAQRRVRAQTIRNVKFLTEFLLLTGLRVGEALALEWEDFEQGYKTVKVVRRVYKGAVHTPKSETSERTVPVAPSLRRALRQRRGDPAGTAYVFTNGRGREPLDYWTAERIFKEAAALAEIGDARIHLCRHTLASWLLRPRPRGLGVSLKQAQVWLGHHSAAFTLDRYSHFMPEDLPDAKPLDPFLRGNNGATRANQNGRGSTNGQSRKNGSIKPSTQIRRVRTRTP
ncbi:MAG: tyrosine-type recombinase/integrase [Gaiellaceae bacterium]